MPTLDVDDTSIFYTLVGSGPTALVLHGGLGVDHSLYRGLDPLAQQLRLVYCDHRGNGRSGRPDRETMTMAQWADDAVALADELTDEQIVVIGHSYGGFIAQELAIRHTDRLAGLILLNTTPGQLGTGEEPAPEGPPVPPEFEDLLASIPDSDAELGESYRSLFPAYLHKVRAKDVEHMLDGTIFDVAAMARGFEVLSEWSSVDRLATVDAPTLLVVGRHDAFTAWHQSERIASRLRDAEVAILEESGHLPWLDQPDEFFAAIGDWLGCRAITP
jgi:proline iminopeptidase